MGNLEHSSRCFLAFLFAILLLAQPAAPSSEPSSAPGVEPTLEAVEFLAGAWGTDGVIVEYWLPPMRGLMVGLNREPSGSGMPFFEYLRIEARDDGVYYVASPKGTGTTDFKLTASSSNRAVFENPDHDFPQKIAYTRTGNRMQVEVTAQKDGEWSGFSLDWEAMDGRPSD